MYYIDNGTNNNIIKWESKVPNVFPNIISEGKIVGYIFLSNNN